MLNFQTPKVYSLEQTQTLICKIAKYITSNPFILQEIGVFRESGTLSHSLEIIEHLLKHEKFYIRKYSVHDYIGALKQVLINTLLFDPAHPAVIELKTQLCDVPDDMASYHLRDFIAKLAKSPHENDKMVSKIIYNYLHLLSHTLLFEAKNKMSATNLGIVAGPFLANHLESDPKKIISLSLKLNGIIEHLLREGSFVESYETSFEQANHVPTSNKKSSLLFLSKRKILNKPNMNSQERDPFTTKLKKK